MTLRNFICRLEEIERANPGKDIGFETIETRVPERITMRHYLADITSDDLGADISCTIQVSSRPTQPLTDEKRLGDDG